MPAARCLLGQGQHPCGRLVGVQRIDSRHAGYVRRDRLTTKSWLHDAPEPIAPTLRARYRKVHQQGPCGYRLQEQRAVGVALSGLA
jgi:hypothetical protein